MSAKQKPLPQVSPKLWAAADKTAWQVAKEIAPAFSAMDWTWGGHGPNDESYIPSVHDIATCLRSMLKDIRKTMEQNYSRPPRLWQRTGRLFVEVAFDDCEEWCADMGIADSHPVCVPLDEATP